MCALYLVAACVIVLQVFIWACLCEIMCLSVHVFTLSSVCVCVHVQFGPVRSQCPEDTVRRD